MRIRLLAPLTLSALVLATTACGGGGGGSGGGAGTATLAGQIVTRNGTTSNRGGLQITFLGNGRTVTSDGTGGFAFGRVPAGTIALRVHDPLAPNAARTAIEAGNVVAQREAESGGAGETEPGDDNGDDVNGDANDDGDDHDTGDDDFDVPGVDDGESLEVRVSVDNGVITSVEVARTGIDDRGGESRLEAAATSDDLDAEGEAELRSTATSEMLKIKAEHLTVGRSVKAFVIHEGIDADLGAASVGADGKVSWFLSTELGDVLPHGAATAADLVGDGVEVRDATTGLVLLVGTLASVPDSVDDHNGDGNSDDNGGGGDGDRAEGRALLTAAGGVPGEAHVDVEHRTGEEPRDKFKVEVEGQTSGLVVKVLVADGANVLTSVGTMTVGGIGRAEFERDTHDGDLLPLGVTDVTDLAGRAIELRDNATNALLYNGTVPTPVVGD